MQLKRNSVIALFLALGFKATTKLTNEKLKAKLEKLNEMPDIGALAISDEMVQAKVAEPYRGNLNGEKLTKGKNKILAAITAKEAIEVVDDAPATAPAAPAAVAPGAGAADETVPVKETEAQKKAREAQEKKAEADKKAAEKKAAEDKKAAEKKAKEDEKAKKKAEADAKKASQLKGVRETKTRPWMAGQIIKKHGGLAAGVTDAMVAELDAAYGKANPTESMFCMRNAWHAIRGFLDVAVVPNAPATTGGTDAPAAQTAPVAEDDGFA